MSRLLLAIPMWFGPRLGFWERDVGLTVLALRKLGHDAWLVAHGGPATETEGMPVLPIAPEEMRSPAWWQGQKPDGAVVNLWSAPRHDAIRSAALSATPRVIERLDTDGIRSPRLFPLPYLVRTWGDYHDHLPAYGQWLAPFLAVAKTSVLAAFPSLLDEKMAKTMARLPMAMAESPIAAERMRRTVAAYTGARLRIEAVPHPVNEDAIPYTGAAKENRIITVGRWAAAQKDFPMLRRVLRAFLQRRPDWQATVVGGGVPARDRGATGEEWQRRVTWHERLEPGQLGVEFSRARIYLMASRYESFCIAAAEALCCGCSVAGSSEVPSSSYFAEIAGRVAPRRTREDFVECLEAETQAWARGERDPKAIAQASRARMGARAVAETVLRLWGEI